MDSHTTPQDRPEPQRPSGAHADRRYARRIDCGERPRQQPRAEPLAAPARPRDDRHP
ncbi:MAG TPA: hypothetical protein VFY65_16560 [Longimicrobium sp.]|nr:hypothetical protein [Longimicrobium sp.]